jgi:nitrogen fixation NifU-like protein
MSDLLDLYGEVIKDHGSRPRNFYKPEDANRTAHGHNAMCGDTIDVFLTVDADGRIQNAAFKGEGCAICTASASVMTELLPGKTKEEVEKLFKSFHAICLGHEEEADLGSLDEDVAEYMQMFSGVHKYPMRPKCATLPWHTMDKAMNDTAKQDFSV